MQTFDHPKQAAQWLRAAGCVNLHSDSRHAAAGDGFLAWPGARHDGRQQVGESLERGVTAVLVEAEGLQQPWVHAWPANRVASMPSLKQQAGHVASAFYGHPSQQMRLVAVTGTNGKTTITWWLAQALSALGQPSGIAGTLGVGAVDRLRSTGLTTLQSVELHTALAQMQSQGLNACTLEASSIGLVEGRLNGAQFEVAIFTNLSQDHLDYHSDMASYWAAKKSLMFWPQLRHAVINIDDSHGAELATQWTGSAELWTTSVRSDARLSATDLEVTDHGMRCTINERLENGFDQVALSIHTAGTFNVSNALQVVAALRAMGLPLADIAPVFSQLKPVPGRLQGIHSDERGPWVFVDYAHTPDAVAQVLAALRPAAAARQGALWCVLGCGGNRDKSKRAPMATQAQAHADHVVLTSDNPRDDDPEAILQDMQPGLTRPADWIGIDRAQAIAYAIAHASTQDIVVIAGKGHENYQEIGGCKLPFSDADVALAAWQLRTATGGRV